MDTITIFGPLVHNEAAKRFELAVEGHIAFVEYSRTNDILILAHTEVPAVLEGHGIGKAVVLKTLEFIEQQNWKIVPLCPFVTSYIARNPEWKRIVNTLH